MTFPLSPAQGSALNAAHSPDRRRYDDYEIRKYTTTSTTDYGEHLLQQQSQQQQQQQDDGDYDDQPSSPLISHTSTMPVSEEQENNNSGGSSHHHNGDHSEHSAAALSPSKRRHSRVISGTELSPLKILNRKRGSESRDDGEEHGDESRGSMGPPPARNQRRMVSSTIKRFPVKVSGGEETHRATAAAAAAAPASASAYDNGGYRMEDALRKNQGLQDAIEIFEDGDSSMEEGSEGRKDVQGNDESAAGEEAGVAAGADDTMASTFSTFSAVPNLTTFAKLGQSPAKASVRGPSPLKMSRPSTKDESGNTTNLLMDFTDQLRFPHKSPERRGNLPSSMTTPNIPSAGQGLTSTPSRRLTNLIDFDIPPLPTPRSVPSITPRELESLKSEFLSQISSLKASLSGKEAEVQSLKTAVGDAEKRVGETMEQLREESALKEQISAEKEDWEKRGLEMEKMLREVKEDIEMSQSEREDLERKLEESEKRREAAEMMHQEAESKIAGLRAGKDSASSGNSDKAASPGQTNKEVEMAVERVARELHTLYKSKHETKVTALKKSYEARWEKKVKDLERRLAEATEQKAVLERAASSKTTESGGAAADSEARRQQAVKDSAAIKELNAEIQRLEAVLASVQKDNEGLRVDLEKERVEKGELVQLAEEMMSMQSFVGGASQRPPARTAAQQQQQPERTVELTKTPKASSASAENRRGSMSRASGLRAPGSAYKGQSRTSIGGASSGVSRFGAPTPRRSGIMGSIEKMGSHRGRGQQQE